MSRSRLPAAVTPWTPLLAPETKRLERAGKVSEGAIRQRVNTHTKPVKAIANQLAADEMAFEELPIATQGIAELNNGLNTKTVILPGAGCRAVCITARRLNTQADILNAIEWLISDIPGSEVAVLADVLRPLASNFSEGRPEVAAILKDLRYPRNRKSSWSLACAILALDAHRLNDLATFWAAGFEVLKSSQQGRRGSHHNRKMCISDSLDTSIVEYLADFPAAISSEIFQSFADMAGSFHAVLVEYDRGKDELVCQLDAGKDELSNVGREEFARRVRRATGCM